MEYLAIDYASTGSFSKTVTDYLHEEEVLKPFYTYEPEASSVPDIIGKMKSSASVDRTLLINCLRGQYKDLLNQLPAQTTDNIAALGDENTFTVTTAHQLNLFGGPLYYIFKIVNVIRLARDLNEMYPKYHFVPCYWMGSEDHDFQEVNHTYLFGKKVEWTNYQGGAMGSYSTDGIEELIPQIKDIIRQGPHLDEVTDLLHSAYSANNLAEAVRRLLLQLFGEEGLVVVDGNCRSLKAIFKPVIKEELLDSKAEIIVNDQINKLEDAGYRSKASPRTINLFYSHGRSRERIIRDGEGFALADSERKFTREELLALVESSPEHFSPNVILRPVHQQMVLPNIAYIGGGSEVAYWLQLKTLMEHYSVHYPMLLLRTSALFIPGHIIKKLNKLGIDKEDIFKEVELLKKDFIARNQEIDLELEDEQQLLKSFYEQLQAKSAKIDASLDKWVGAEGQKALKSLDNISKRLVRSEKARNDQSMSQIIKLKDTLFPNGGLTERRENFLPYYAIGGKEWLHKLTETLDPFERKFYLIY